jgi:hypothetical protein
MAYNFTVPERLDISRNAENVHARIKVIAIQLESKSISLEVQRVNRDTYESTVLLYSLINTDFNALAAAVPSGTNMYDAIKGAAWDFLLANKKEEISFNGSAPLDAEDDNGTLFESIPVWTEA